MKNLLVRMIPVMFVLMLAISVNACSSGTGNSKDSNADKSSNSTSDQQTTTGNDVKEKTDAPPPNVNQQNTKQGTTGQAWEVPDAAKNKKNPVKMTADSKDNGKSLYAKHCASCHGKSGAGDGPRSSTLKTKMADLKSSAAQNQTDGSLFYKTSEGKGEMPSYKKKLSENEIWDIVNFMRSLK